MFANNCTRHDAAGYSPSYLLYEGSSPLPIDIIFEIDPDYEVTSYQDYVLKWKREIHHNMLRSDRVLVPNLEERGGPGKHRLLWENKIHEAVEINEDSPVYSVKAEDGTGKVRVFYGDLLLSCEYLLAEKPPQPVTSSKKSSHC